MEEYTTSYDYRDYERSEWIPSKPATEPKNVSDGLREWIESLAGRPFLENTGKDKEGVHLGAWWDEDIDEYENNYDWENEKQELLEESARTPMYDFGTGKMSNERDMVDFYGAKIVSRIQREIRESVEMPDKERKTGHISKELWQELKDIRAGKKPRSNSAIQNGSSEIKSPVTPISNEKNPTEKPKEQLSREIKVVQRERQPGDDYFLSTERGIIRNETYRELFKGPGVVYEWLWANLVRSEWIDTKGYPIKEKYYDKGYLAYCSSYRHIAKKCGLHKNKVKEFIDKFVRAGIIRVETLVPEGKKRGQSVFILGTWKMENGKRLERNFRNEIFLSGKVGQNVPN